MILNAHLTLEGEYTAEVYNKEGTLLRTIGPHKNFITSTGLSFISKHAIADCFRFVSLGTDNAKNTLIGNDGWGTWYLSAPSTNPDFMYIGSRTEQSDAGHVTTQYNSATFTERPSGITLTRGWRIPAGEKFFDADYTFKEVMLSPGKPYVTGIDSSFYLYMGVPTTLTWTTLQDTAVSPPWVTNEFRNKYVYISDQYSDNYQDAVIRKILSNTSNSLTFATLKEAWDTSHSLDHFLYTIYDTFQLCSCSESAVNQDNNTIYGGDCANIADYYRKLSPPKQICDSSGAFVRIVKDIDVAKDNFLVFNYSLNINVETGIYNFIVAPINNRGVNTTTNWSVHPLSGSHNLIHHGVKYISKGTCNVTTPFGGGGMPQIPSFDADADFGESFTASWGSPLEPSTPASNLKAYITTDNLQFFTNALDGGAYTAGDGGLIGRLSGLMLFRKSPYTTLISEGNISPRHYNIRRNDAAELSVEATPYWPISTNYGSETQTPSEALPGFEVAVLDQGFDTSVNVVNFDNPATRTRQITRSFQFIGNTAAAMDNFNTKPLRGIVLSYVGEGYEKYHFPYLDCLFTDSGAARYWDGDSYEPVPNSIQAPQLVPTGNIAKTSFDNKSYSEWYWLDGYPNEDVVPGLLTFSFVETWGSPCSPDVDGC